MQIFLTISLVQALTCNRLACLVSNGGWTESTLVEVCNNTEVELFYFVMHLSKDNALRH